MLEALARAIVAIPLLFMNDIKVMIVFVLIVISIELTMYSCLKRTKD